MFGLFIIEAGSEPQALLGRDGKPLVYDSGSEAALMSRVVATGGCWDNYYTPCKVQPRPLATDAWKARELGRFADGTYVPLPWADLPKLSLTAEHFAHISTEDGAKIAYTQDAAKGAGDIQTRVRPGKYLTQFYSDTLDAPTIARMAAEFSNQYGESNVLLFAETADEIERVYENGPRSCMAHSESHFASSEHPVRIYAAGDLAVAYMVRNDEITARALVWPAKGIFGRIYGDETRLIDLLETAGYAQGSLKGARMTRIAERGGFVCPYIDDTQSAGDDGEHLILGGHGICGSNQNGLSCSMCCCSSCDTELDEDNSYSDDNGDYYCVDCWGERYGYCDRNEEDCDRDTMEEVITTNSRGSRVTQIWGERAINQHASRCEGSGNLYDNDLIVTLEDGTTWSQEYFDTHGIEVDGTNYVKGEEPQDDEETEEVVATVQVTELGVA